MDTGVCVCTHMYMYMCSTHTCYVPDLEQQMMKDYYTLTKTKSVWGPDWACLLETLQLLAGDLALQAYNDM